MVLDLAAVMFQAGALSVVIGEKGIERAEV